MMVKRLRICLPLQAYVSSTVSLRSTPPKGVTGLCPEPRRYGLLSHSLSRPASASA